MISSDLQLQNSLTSPLILIQYPSTEDVLNDISPNFDQQLQQGSEAAAELNRQVNALDQQLQQAPPLDLLKDIGPLANQGQPLSLPEVGKQRQYRILGYRAVRIHQMNVQRIQQQYLHRLVILIHNNVIFHWSSNSVDAEKS